MLIRPVSLRLRPTRGSVTVARELHLMVFSPPKPSPAQRGAVISWPRAQSNRMLCNCNCEARPGCFLERLVSLPPPLLLLRTMPNDLATPHYTTLHPV